MQKLRCQKGEVFILEEYGICTAHCKAMSESSIEIFAIKTSCVCQPNCACVKQTN